MSIFITDGNTGNGKSYLASMDFINLLKRNIIWWQKGKLKTKRFVATNIDLNSSLLNEYKDFVKQFSDLDQLTMIRNSDVIFDDMGWYVNARRWASLPDSVTEWFRTHEHYGCDVYGNCQDIIDIDVSIRKLVKGATHVTKILGSPRPADSKPTVKHIWGVLMIREMNIDTKEKPSGSRKYHGFPRLEFIRKKYCNVYSTLQEFVRGKYPPVEHIARYCKNPECKHFDIPLVTHR